MILEKFKMESCGIDNIKNINLVSDNSLKFIFVFLISKQMKSVSIREILK